MPTLRITPIATLCLACICSGQNPEIATSWDGTGEHLELLVQDLPSPEPVYIAISIDVSSPDPFVNNALKWAYPDFVPVSRSGSELKQAIEALNSGELIDVTVLPSTYTIDHIELNNALLDVNNAMNSHSMSFEQATQAYCQFVPPGSGGSTLLTWDTAPTFMANWASQPTSPYIDWSSLLYVGEGAPAGTTHMDSILLATEVVVNQLSETNPMAVQQIVNLMGEDDAYFGMNFTAFRLEAPDGAETMPGIQVLPSIHVQMVLPIPDAEGNGLIRKPTLTGWIYPVHVGQLARIQMTEAPGGELLGALAMEFGMQGGPPIRVPVDGQATSAIVAAAVPDGALTGNVQVINTVTNQPVPLHQPEGATQSSPLTVQIVVLQLP